MKVTLDSNEPLADAMRVIGALYNVTLAQVAAATADDTTTAGAGAGAGAAKDQPRRAATAKPSRRSRAKTAKVSSPSRSGRSRRTEAVSSSDVRAWAVANGHAVSNRGTLPAAIRSAYAEAHKS